MFEQFPYANFHELNMDWIVKIAKDFLDQYTHIQDTINSGLTSLDNKATELEGLLQAWYDTHSEDIANQLAQALEQLAVSVAQRIHEFNQAADQKTANSIASIPADYTSLANDVRALTDVYDDLGLTYQNLFDPTRAVNGYLNGNGIVFANPNYSTTAFIDVSNISRIGFSFTNFGGWYTTNADSGFISPLNSTEMNSLAMDKYIDVPSNAHYLRVSYENANSSKVQIGVIADRYNYIAPGQYKLLNAIIDSSQIDGTDYLERTLGYEHYNIFNPNDSVSGYLAGNGQIASNANFRTSNYIDVSGYDTISFSYTNFGGWFSSADVAGFIPELNTSEMNSLSLDKSIAVPANAHYLRVTYEPRFADKVQIGKSVSRYDYKSYNDIDLTYVKLSENPVIVALDGTGDYTSFTQAIYETVDSGRPVIVRPGRYDITTEYINLFGQDVVDAMSDESTGMNDFQYGVRIHDREVLFDAASEIYCNWTRTINATHRFSVLRVEQGAYIEGMHLIAVGTFYGVHDDYGPVTPFTIHYKNCRFVCYDLYNHNCIGGGCHKYSTHILEGCYFTNHVNNTDDLVLSADVRYHNTNTPGAEPELYISNCWFAHNLNLCYYGEQTTRMKAYVNNCKAPRGINIVQESSSMSTQNIDLYKWCNEEG